MSLNKGSVGKIAERIVMNELESRGFRVTDLNKDGVSANADLIAAGFGKTWQIQVKGATNDPESDRWWIQYGHCTKEVIEGKLPAFNQKQSFYCAQFVIFVAVKAPNAYQCFVFPLKYAEEAAQLNLDRYYRQPRKRDGGERQPGKVWVYVESTKRERPQSQRNTNLLKRERALLKRYKDNWGLLRTMGSRNALD